MDRGRHRRALYAAIFISSAVYFIVFSDGGILERMNIERSKKEIIANNRSIEMENARLKDLLSLYRSGEYLPEDTFQSGYIRPGDRVLAITEKEGSPDISDNKKSLTFRRLSLSHLRLVWIIFSCVTISSIAVYEWKSRRKQNNHGGDDPWQA